MRIEETRTIDASPEDVFAVMSDVERWPAWTPSALKAERDEQTPLTVGSSALMRIRGASRVSSKWTVTALVPGRSFVWESRSGGVHSVGRHEAEPEGAGSRAKLWIEFSGAGAFLFGPWLRRVATKNVRDEADGLKARAESRK